MKIYISGRITGTKDYKDIGCIQCVIREEVKEDGGTENVRKDDNRQ